MQGIQSGSNLQSGLDAAQRGISAGSTPDSKAANTSVIRYRTSPFAANLIDQQAETTREVAWYL